MQNSINTNAPTVDELLDSIDLTFPGYEPSDQALHFWSTMQLIKGEAFFSLGIPILHYYFVDLVFGNVTREMFPYGQELNSRLTIRNRKLAILCSRGLAKSTVFSSFLVIYMAMFGRLPGLKRAGTGDKVWFVIGIGDSQENGAKVMCNTLRDMIDESDILKAYFEDIRCTDAEIELVRVNDESNPTSRNERSFMFRTKGAQSGIRGQRYRGERVDCIIGDDLISTEADSRSKVIQKSIRGTIYSDAVSALRFTGGMQILIGTPFNKNDIVYSAIEKGWTPLVVPVCKKITPTIKKEEWVGAWPEAHTYEAVMDSYTGMMESDALREFNQERMLRIASEDDRLVKDKDIQWYSRIQLNKVIDSFNIVFTTDLTASNELKGDYSVIMAWAVNAIGEYYMLDCSIKKQTINQQFDTLMRMVQQWAGRNGRHATVGIEVDGQQRLNVNSLKNMMRERNVYFSFARQIGKPLNSEGITRRSGGDKHEHFMRVHSMMQNRKIYLPEEIKESPDMEELLTELKYVTYAAITSKHDDALDGLSMLPLMDTPLPADSSGGMSSGVGTAPVDTGNIFLGRQMPTEPEEDSNSVVF